MNNQITIFMKKIILKYWCKNCPENFDINKFKNHITDGSKKSYMKEKITLYTVHCLISMLQITNLYDKY